MPQGAVGAVFQDGNTFTNTSLDTFPGMGFEINLIRSFPRDSHLLVLEVPETLAFLQLPLEE
ncbi:hypothetical protein ANCCEY_06779 [Ancylostoma ceylanicum]|uniref:Uncharacterized protein n=1 Tax=Ancylostoma ceylanicum TaxID=53326 RepID=A0A0D6LQ28_9BILA|nr:hypothetical protein ANCCEY_06779 [Ancylostoma ceylanicum]